MLVLAGRRGLSRRDPAEVSMTTASVARYRRVLLKLSGESLMGAKGYGIELAAVERIAREIKAVHDLAVQICIVIGGGNIFRGVSDAAVGIERATADHIGMMATVMNALALQSVLESLALQTRVQSAIPMAAVCEPYIRRRAIRHMEKDRVVILAAGTGNPFFTTDTAAALRAVETGCEVIVKATQVDGVYDADPHREPSARRFAELSYHEVLSRDLKVMDTSAVALARDNSVPIIVFRIHNPGALPAVLQGQGTYTIIH
jgi:uridylate kinase